MTTKKTIPDPVAILIPSFLFQIKQALKLLEKLLAHRQFEAHVHGGKQEYEKQNPEERDALAFIRTDQDHFHHANCQQSEKELDAILRTHSIVH